MNAVRFAPLTALVALAGPLACASPAAADVPPPSTDVAKATGTRTAVFAAGCFWCVEAVFEAVTGVSSVVSGYAGDAADNAKYDLVSAGRTRHAEAVEITYDPARVSYGQLLQVLLTTSDPTTKDRQGPDVGAQYRSAVFYRTDEERKVAEAYLAQLTAAKTFEKPIVVQVEKLAAFYPAEDYHQDFVKKHPDHPYVRAWSVPKLTKLLKKLPNLVKPAR